MAVFAVEQETHRPGVFKQPNKAHKAGRHRTKGQVDSQCKGRTSVKTQSRRQKHETSRVNRRNQAQQRRQVKRQENMTLKRSIGGRHSAPHLVAVISLHSDCDVKAVVDKLTSCDESAVQSQTGNELISDLGLQRFKKRLTFLATSTNMAAILDGAKVADSLLFVVSPTECWDSFGDMCLTCIFSQGLPATTIITQGLDSVPIKKRNNVKQILQTTIEQRFPAEKLYALDTDQEGVLLLRHIAEQRLQSIKWRDRRPHLLARRVTFEPNQEHESIGTLKVSGFLRGSSLSVNSLVHLPGFGTFQMSQMDASPDPCPLTLKVTKRKRTDNMPVDTEHAMEEDVLVLEKADPSMQESLDSETVHDPMDGEQTWPTDEEIAEAQAAMLADANVTKKVKKVPKGMSDYQAAWIIDGDEDISEDEDDEETDDEFHDAMSQGNSDDERLAPSQVDTDMDYESISVTSGKAANYDDDYDDDKEQEMLTKYKEERLEVLFPDEIDTPVDADARVRFARYRGLKSFRTSPWDPKENLPQDYSRIFQFENFNRTRKRVLAEKLTGGAQTGNFIVIHIANVPQSFMEGYDPSKPLVVFSLLPHEQKMSVLHFAIKRYRRFTEPIKSKERLIFQVGPMQFSACPILSQHSNGDKHKYLRFLPKDDIIVATVYAPIVFPPATVIVFKEVDNGCHNLIATGTMLSANPNRVVTKKISLSGHPFKITNRNVVVRYMFFNREDIMWFKPVELYTKWGRRGHIREPLGTHGHMKCTFDGNLKSQDVVLLNLYKRVYPKWTYDCCIQALNVTESTTDEGLAATALADMSDLIS